ncbi:hypothetical protein FACS189446_8940 [Bacteroidia bacterium]|nr:hypothetical protein FACS189446_8940 [Bacteroidia bacterium]
MKKKNFLTLLNLLFLSVAMFSCSENNGFDDDDDNNNSSNSDNKLKEGQIELRGFSDSNAHGTLSFYAATDKITIDWGDGSKINEITPNGVEQRFYHEYANQNFQTALINTKKLTLLGLSDRSSEGYWKEVRIGSCLDLQKIGIGSNHKITVLNIKNAPSLTWLSCGGNRLTSLDISGCKALTELSCGGNQLTSLDVSGCKALTELSCSNNQLTSLDLSGCEALTTVDCSGNQLTSLDVSGCKALTTLNCNNHYYYPNKNQLTASALNALFQSLPTVESGTIFCYDNPGYGTCDKSIATKKGWKV